MRHPGAEARLQRSRLFSSLVASVTLALFAGFAFDKGLRAAAVFAALIVLGIAAFALLSWRRWTAARRELRTAPPDLPVVPEADPAPELHIDADLDALSREALVEEVVKLRNAIRAHRDSTGHDLCGLPEDFRG